MASRGHSEGITMSGGGLYSLATIGAKHVIDAATPIVVDAINSLSQESIAAGFTFSDMGTADAGTKAFFLAPYPRNVRSNSAGK